ncbi:ATPase AAA-type core [Penicillium chermesinum]|uniref:ATPase AAA-type core n=1 Tax=Penicillium chermesinum TaxID=63820 RepID=A0A9W9TST6_9EURO|nr:ATPase AAA-type core [Penicillium chermesinum]KAJ5240100.1 ATPase AAA-type core [Penicillium chermesinum]
MLFQFQGEDNKGYLLVISENPSRDDTDGTVRRRRAKELTFEVCRRSFYAIKTFNLTRASGLPGVRKTFIVEVTSEYFKLLLYLIAKHFSAVLLLDEADTFMEQRISYYDTHNRLVTICLGKLEYYQGILFLTSSRGIRFDDAILSRIYLIIEYENLPREFHRDLWSTFLSKGCSMQGPAVVEEHELRRLESLDLKRREVPIF